MGEHHVAFNVFPEGDFEGTFPFQPLGRVQCVERALAQRGWVPVSVAVHVLPQLAAEGGASYALRLVNSSIEQWGELL